jgi:hypothetical protein
MFRVAPPLELKKLEAIFRHKVFKMLNRGKITKEVIAMLSTWRHSGFNVFCGNRISPTGVSRWSGTTDITVMSHGGNEKKLEKTMPSLAFSNRWEMKKRSGKMGLG